MALVLTRKDRESVEITHGGETLKVTMIQKTAGKPQLSFEGPRSFVISRSENVAEPMPNTKESQMSHEASPADCFVRAVESGPMMKGEIVRWNEHGSESTCDVKLTDGTVLKRVSLDNVRVVNKVESKEIFGSR